MGEGLLWARSNWHHAVAVTLSVKSFLGKILCQVKPEPQKFFCLLYSVFTQACRRQTKYLV